MRQNRIEEDRIVGIRENQITQDETAQSEYEKRKRGYVRVRQNRTQEDRIARIRQNKMRQNGIE